jgi:hypothetical protein
MVACELANGSNTYIDMPFGNLSVRRMIINSLKIYIYLDVICENSRFGTDLT